MASDLGLEIAPKARIETRKGVKEKEEETVSIFICATQRIIMPYKADCTTDWSNTELSSGTKVFVFCLTCPHRQRLILRNTAICFLVRESRGKKLSAN
jgi:hypothetical protein